MTTKTNYMKSLIDIGSNIRKLREKKNFTQQYVADELNISRVQYGAIERGENDITITRLYNISKILEITIEQILELEKKDIYMVNNVNSNGNSTTQINDLEIVNKLIALYEEKITNLENQLSQLKNE